MIWTLKKYDKKTGLPCLFTRQRALKMGCFSWLGVKTSNHLHTELRLGYPKDTKFYLESKACGNIVLFQAVPWLAWSRLALAKIHPVGDYFPKKYYVLPSNFFSSSSMFFIRLLLDNTWKNKSGVTVLISEKRRVYFAIELSLSEISYVLYVNAPLHARWWRENRAQ